jgi:hypothetical protein
MYHPDKSLLALGIRQPWIELILRGIKSIEVRSVETSVRGTIYLYSSTRLAEGVPAEDAAARAMLACAELPLGLIVGTVEIVDCRPCTPQDSPSAQLPAGLLQGKQAWVLANPRRLSDPIRPRFRPYGIWFYPFQRKNGSL